MKKSPYPSTRPVPTFFFSPEWYVDLWPYRTPTLRTENPFSPRLEFGLVPVKIIERALLVTDLCYACWDPIHPVREREKSRESRIAGTVHESRIYFSPVCQPAVKSGCANTDYVSEYFFKVAGYLQFHFGDFSGYPLGNP